MYLTDKARYSYLTQLPEGADIGRSINEAMDAIENENEDLKVVLPRNYNVLDNRLLSEVLRIFNSALIVEDE